MTSEIWALPRVLNHMVAPCTISCREWYHQTSELDLYSQCTNALRLRRQHARKRLKSAVVFRAQSGGPEWFVSDCLLCRRCVLRGEHVPVFFFQAEDGIRDLIVTGVQTCALPI